VSENQMTPANWSALDACQRCPVRLMCLKTALDEGLDDGIFGGMLASQRKRMSKKAKVSKQPEGWTVTQQQSRAVAGSWHAAVSFAMRVAK